MSNPRLLTTELVRLPNGDISQVIIRTNGWRIDIDVPDPDKYEELMVNIANGDQVGWCACAFDGTEEMKVQKDLTLNGSEVA